MATHLDGELDWTGTELLIMLERVGLGYQDGELAVVDYQLHKGLERVRTARRRVEYGKYLSSS
jgi:hypothetical protein